ncbi:glutathione ABC transporter permease [Elstera cyanobacteriorum]|uniref:Glutathione ABC transporter permease GsiC n=1 Tax=Elstera cyanobacteriorum TaxID=2022747 RepID=A0A255XRE0_9PROT|nr:ABC transporter permease [Elstera cyanobacteriorum]OYQ19451.1 glutathione ABC transporter permease GsiC [Elstera cyanobacteriorum]GFZ91546.1 glutathione ABC transporter permease [Elstera cyanobacteriorum]
MLGYFLKRFALLLPVFLAMSMVIFAIVHLVPGDPIDHMLQIGSSVERRAELMAQLGFDKPLPVQYVLWLGRMLTGDFGTALILKQPVLDLILQNLPYSLALGGLSLAVAMTLGVATGALAAIFRDSWLDRAVMTLILLGSTVPAFWLGLLLILGFAVQLEWFPVSGARTWEALVLPVATISLGGIALVARVTRAAMGDIARQDFVMMLHAKGVPAWQIYLKHILRHALLPIVTLLALKIGWILGGAVTIEFVFARPGLGTLLINALSQRDYPLVQGCLLMLGCAVLLGTLLGDLVQVLMDPRMRDRIS